MNQYLIRNIQALCLIALVYWGLNYSLDIIFYTTSMCFLIIANVSTYFENKTAQEIK